jgi:hypothetical protein
MPDIATRLKHAWNAFNGRDSTVLVSTGSGSGRRPDRPYLTRGTERSMILSMYNRISMDVSGVNINHVRLDDDQRFIEIIQSSLNSCLTVEANKDQTGRALIQDIVLSMFDEGCVALVPIDTTLNPNVSGSFDILSLRTGRVTQWFPDHVIVNIYDDRSGYGYRHDIALPKKSIAIIENPLYSVMNEPNSTLKRLIRKLNILDSIDEQSGSGKLDIIVQLPYVVKTPARKEQAETRRKDVQEQLRDSQYGIAYIDATEKITQLNRPAENNLMGQIEYLTSMLYGQLGITQEVFNGTADEKTMNNYYNRTVEPILSAIVEAMIPKFLTRTARSQGQSLAYYRDPFKLVPAKDLAELVDSFTRNAVLSSNEFRGIIGYKPSDQEGSDELRNKNLNPATEGVTNNGEY